MVRLFEGSEQQKIEAQDLLLAQVQSQFRNQYIDGRADQANHKEGKKYKTLELQALSNPPSKHLISQKGGVSIGSQV